MKEAIEVQQTVFKTESKTVALRFFPGKGRGGEVLFLEVIHHESHDECRGVGVGRIVSKLLQPQTDRHQGKAILALTRYCLACHVRHAILALTLYFLACHVRHALLGNNLISIQEGIIRII